MLTLNRDNLKGFVDTEQIKSLWPKITEIHHAIENKTAEGNEFTGWTDLPNRIENTFLKEIIKLGDEVRKQSDCLISIGIGGSYLGIKAAIEYNRGSKLPVYFIGQNMNTDYIYDLLAKLKNKRISVVVISKSGTTTEPALAFRIVKQFLSKKYSAKQLQKRIICVTDASKGALKQIADRNGYRSFIIPDDVGGRFSVLTPVGLVPLAIAGLDIKSLVEGARAGQKDYSTLNFETNIAYQYAAIRYLLHERHGKMIEVLSSFYDNLYFTAEWWKQLFGESEGKMGKGILPSSLTMTADLHSLGQLMQEGIRNVFETFLVVDKANHKITIPKEKDDLDKFNFVAGKDLDYVNKQAYHATAAAHYEGGVPNMTITLCKSDLFHLGQLFYFFERAVAMSGYLSGVNPFNQPGVEAYKKKMFELLGKK